MIKIGFLVPDNRQEFGQWELPAPTFGPAPKALLDGFVQLDDCEVHVIFCLKRPLPMPDRLAPNIIPHALLVPPLGYLKTLYFGCARAIRREVHRLGVQIVHGQGSERFPAYCATRCGLPNVITLHGNMRQLAKFHRARPLSFQWMAALVEGWAVRRTDGVVAISSYTKKLVKNTTPRTWTLPNAVDESFFTVQRNPQAVPQIICAANILTNKNQVALIHALAPLAGELKFTLKFVGKLGPDPYAAEFLEAVRANPWCEAPGAVDQAGLREELSRSAFLVLPTLQDNCPMVILEAMAAGLPVAASRIGGVPDLVEENVTGWMFDPNDPNMIRDVVRRLLADPAKAAAMGEAARTAATRRFRPKLIAQRHLEIYREVIAAKVRK